MDHNEIIIKIKLKRRALQSAGIEPSHVILSKAMSDELILNSGLYYNSPDLPLGTVTKLFDLEVLITDFPHPEINEPKVAG